MKTIYSLFIILFISSTLSAKTIKVIGAFTNFENIQQKGEFLLPVQYLNKELVYRLIQWRVLFTNAEGQELLLTPTNCTGFQIFYKDKWMSFKSVDNIYGWKNPFRGDAGKIFMEVIVDGKISLLSYHIYSSDNAIYFEDGNGGGNGMSAGGRVKASLFFYKDDRLTRYNKSTWKKDLKTLLWRDRDFAEAVNQIRRKEIPRFLEEYNTSLKKKSL